MFGVPGLVSESFLVLKKNRSYNSKKAEISKISVS